MLVELTTEVGQTIIIRGLEDNVPRNLQSIQSTDESTAMRKTWKAFCRPLMIAVALGIPALCSADDWLRYENDFFIAYSRADEDFVREILLELELFRAATLQVFALEPPENAPKTLVIVANSRNEYEGLGGPPGTGGFARREGARTLIVARAKGYLADSRLTIIRHEYAHALLGYDEFDYPQWYEEGFAEMAAVIDIDRDAQTFDIGLPADRYIGRWDGAIDWDELIRDDFNAYNERDGRYVGAAYGQSWLLMHYLSLGDDPENAVRLAQYVADIKRGTASSEAFHKAFGKTAAEMWATEIVGYAERLPYYTLRFRGLTLDRAFDITAATAAELDPLLDTLSLPETGRKAKRLRDLPLGAYDGWWEWPRFSSRCSDMVHIRYAPAGETLTIEWKQEDGAQPADVDVYSFEHDRGGSLLLTRMAEPGAEAEEESDDLGTFLLSLREGDILCITHVDDRPYECGVPLLRCPEPAGHAGSSVTPQ